MAPITLPVGTGAGHAGAKVGKPQIRRASRADGTAILAIYNESLRRGEISRHDHELRLDELSSALPDESRYHTYVAVIDGRIRGWAGFRPAGVMAAYASTLELLVYVAPSHRGRGLAKQLVTRVIAGATRGKYRSIIAVSPADDANAARLLRSTGFFVAGTLGSVFLGLDGLHDVRLYQRLLGGDARSDGRGDAKGEAKTEARAEARTDAKTDAKADVKADATCDARSDASSDATRDEPRSERGDR